MPIKYVYFFSKDFTEGRKELKEKLGGKGANLAEMSSLGLPIPPGFTITTEVCDLFHKNDYVYPEGLEEEVEEKLGRLEKLMGRKLGAAENPLLVSVRSGAAVSMPGMMDTVLNLGINDKSVQGMAKLWGEWSAYDTYRRFIQMFGEVVLGIKHEKFEHILEQRKKKRNIENDVDLEVADLKEVVLQYKELVKKERREGFPQDPKVQLWKTIEAVLRSWNTYRAIKYREMNNIIGLMGTAVNIQAMVFGNLGDTSGSGVAFSRDAANGEKVFYGEYLVNAQGEDVVAGIRTPKPLSRLEAQSPAIYKKLNSYKDLLEQHYRDMQDLEFTIQEGKLFILQTRVGKRTAFAAIKVALDMVEEGLISKEEAVMRVAPDQLDQVLHPNIDPDEKYEVIGRGLPASPGAAVGEIVFTPEKAEELALSGRKVILVRKETSPEDIGGMDAAEGILTATGGLTSHAAVVARGMGKCCVCGCSDLIVNPGNTCTIGGQAYKEGDFITLNGGEGEVIPGKLTLIMPEISDDFEKFMHWVDQERTIGIRTNADTPKDSANARKFGAEGIGLCRTEHMFFDSERINTVREMILAKKKEERKKALNKLLPMQLEDFTGIFEAMDGFPVTIRLLDPPLHEFIPREDEELRALAADRAGEVFV